MDHLAVMEQPVQKRAGHHRILADLTPRTKALIGRQDEGPPLIAARDALEEHMGAVPIDGAIAHLIDEAELGHGLELHAVLQAIVGLGFRQGGDARERRGNQRPVSRLDRLQAQPHGHKGVPRPWWTQEHALRAVI
jgi:hypothetical protein